MSTPALRTVFFGTPQFAVPALQALIDCDVANVIAAVCQPDKPAGRGRKLTPPPIKILAEGKGIPVLQPPKIRGTGFAEEIAAMEPDVAVVAAYGKIFPPDLLAVPKHGCLNIHASLLPRHRGAAPIQWALIHGDSETGVTIMRMDEGCDTGPTIAQEACPILEDDDARSLSDMLSMMGGKLMVEVLSDLAQFGDLKTVPQSDEEATLAPLLTKADGVLDWTQSDRTVLNRIHGVTPWPGAQTAVDGKRLKIIVAERVPADHPDAQPGEVVETDARRGFVVAAGQGFLMVTSVQPEGKAVMSGADAVNGGFVKRGRVFTAPV